jgi:hypothetical protein
MGRTGGTEGGGLSGDQLAGSCFHAFRNAVVGQGGDFPEWQDLDEAQQAGFAAAAKHAEDFFSGDPEEGCSWRMLASNCYWQFCRAAGEQPLEIDLVPADTLRAWEAFGRHANNMMDFDPAEETEGTEKHEVYWNEWAAAKKAAAGVPQQAEAQRPIQENL